AVLGASRPRPGSRTRADPAEAVDDKSTRRGDPTGDWRSGDARSDRAARGEATVRGWGQAGCRGDWGGVRLAGPLRSGGGAPSDKIQSEAAPPPDSPSKRKPL